MPESIDNFDDGVFRRRSSWQYRELPARLQDEDERLSYKSRKHHTKAPLDTDFYLSNDENLNTGRLKHASTVSALLAGFSMEAYVQMELDDGLPAELMILFAVSSTSLIAVNLFALLCSVSLLPTINAYNIVSSRRAKEGQPEMPSKLSPHKRFKRYIVTAWVASVVLGIQLFLFEVIVVTWVHFYIKCKMAAVCVTATIAPAMVLFAIFATHIQTGVLDLQMAPMQQALDYGIEENLHHQGASFDGLSRANSNIIGTRRATPVSRLNVTGSAGPSRTTSPSHRSRKGRDSLSDDYMEFYDADEQQHTSRTSPTPRTTSETSALLGRYGNQSSSPTPAPLYASNRYYQHNTQQPYPLLPMPSSQSFIQPSPHSGGVRVGQGGSSTGPGSDRYSVSMDGRGVATGGNAQPLGHVEGSGSNRLLTKASSVTELMSAPQSSTNNTNSHRGYGSSDRLEGIHRSHIEPRYNSEGDSQYLKHRKPSIGVEGDIIARDVDSTAQDREEDKGYRNSSFSVLDNGLKSLLATFRSQPTPADKKLSSKNSTHSAHSYTHATNTKSNSYPENDRDTSIPTIQDSDVHTTSNSYGTSQIYSVKGRDSEVRKGSTASIYSPSRRKQDKPRLCISPDEVED